MTDGAKGAANEQVTVAFAVEFSIEPPGESVDFDAVGYCGALLRDAISGWGVAVVRLAHLADPDEVFGS
jgi:hypothetical protein